MANLILQIIIILVLVALVYLILYLFQKFVVPVDQKILNIVVFIIAGVLIIYAMTGHQLIFWK